MDYESGRLNRIAYVQYRYNSISKKTQVELERCFKIRNIKLLQGGALIGLEGTKGNIGKKTSSLLLGNNSIILPYMVAVERKSIGKSEEIRWVDESTHPVNLQFNEITSDTAPLSKISYHDTANIALNGENYEYCLFYRNRHSVPTLLGWKMYNGEDIQDEEALTTLKREIRKDCSKYFH